MKTGNHSAKWFAWLTGAAVSALLLAQASTALATPPDTSNNDPNFEIDGNALDNESWPGDDWINIYQNANLNSNLIAVSEQRDAQGNILAKGILPDLGDVSVFTGGGSKDIRDIPAWKWKDGAVPDKDQILHAYAAAYASPNNGGKDLIVYIGADRYSNDGDAMVGAWFFQDAVTAAPGGSFTGMHKNGDLLWLAHFSGGGTISNMQGLIWNEAGKPNYQSGLNQVKGTNLAVLFTADPGLSQVYVPGQYAAAVNTGDTPSPWPFMPKQGSENLFPYNSFMEGGINISAMYRMLGLGTVPCFASFLIETRSSTEVNAQLKDFVLGRLDTCRLAVAKSCVSSVLAPSKLALRHTYEVQLTNSGFGTITSVALRDDAATPGNASDDLSWTYNYPIGPGQTVTLPQYYIDSTLNPPTNTVYATGYIDSYAMAEVQSSATCIPVSLNPLIGARKACTTTVAAEGGKVVVKVGFIGQVCNKADATDPNAPKLIDVTATDSVTGPLRLGTTTLDPGQCTPFSGSYYPDAVVRDGLPSAQSYSDTVTVSGKDPVTNTPATNTATASCRLCPTCPPCPQ